MHSMPDKSCNILLVTLSNVHRTEKTGFKRSHSEDRSPSCLRAQAPPDPGQMSVNQSRWRRQVPGRSPPEAAAGEQGRGGDSRDAGGSCPGRLPSAPSLLPKIWPSLSRAVFRILLRDPQSLNGAQSETLKCLSNCQIKHDNGDPAGGAALFGERISKVLF